jgi:hypothetical protein
LFNRTTCFFFFFFFSFFFAFGHPSGARSQVTGFCEGKCRVKRLSSQSPALFYGRALRQHSVFSLNSVLNIDIEMDWYPSRSTGFRSCGRYRPTEGWRKQNKAFEMIGHRSSQTLKRAGKLFKTRTNFCVTCAVNSPVWTCELTSGPWHGRWNTVGRFFARKKNEVIKCTVDFVNV